MLNVRLQNIGGRSNKLLTICRLHHMIKIRFHMYCNRNMKMYFRLTRVYGWRLFLDVKVKHFCDHKQHFLSHQTICWTEEQNENTNRKGPGKNVNQFHGPGSKYIANSANSLQTSNQPRLHQLDLYHSHITEQSTLTF